MDETWNLRKNSQYYALTGLPHCHRNSNFDEILMSSFWWNFHHWLQPVMKISSKWWHFRFSGRGVYCKYFTENWEGFDSHTEEKLYFARFELNSLWRWFLRALFPWRTPLIWQYLPHTSWVMITTGIGSHHDINCHVCFFGFFLSKSS